MTTYDKQSQITDCGLFSRDPGGYGTDEWRVTVDSTPINDGTADVSFDVTIGQSWSNHASLSFFVGPEDIATGNADKLLAKLAEFRDALSEAVGEFEARVEGMREK